MKTILISVGLFACGFGTCYLLRVPARVEPPVIRLDRVIQIEARLGNGYTVVLPTDWWGCGWGALDTFIPAAVTSNNLIGPATATGDGSVANTGSGNTFVIDGKKAGGTQ